MSASFSLRSGLGLGPNQRCIAARASARRGVHSAAVSAPPAVEEYNKLAESLKEISTLSGVSGLLAWDEQVMMPPAAAAVRGAQTSTLAGIIHEKSTDPSLGHLIDSLLPQIEEGKGEGLGAAERAVIRDAARNYRKSTAVPKEMAQRVAALGSKGFQTWAKARAESDFSLFSPVLQEWIDVTQEKCRLVDPGLSAYDSCLDDYERGMTKARLDEVFGEVKQGLVPLLASIRSAAESGAGPDPSLLAGTFDTKVQAAMCEEIAKDLGFDLTKGRLDVSAHPFTGGSHPTDVRMTTRFKDGDLTEGLTAAVHETGHALYEQGRNAEYYGLPVSEALSMGIHESQSLFWERMIALSPAFCEYVLPKLRASFPHLPADLTNEQLHGAFNCVKSPSLIRVESDEVTYPMHIILRYELEQGLISGEISVKELPELWGAKMEEYLGCTPENDAQGVLQDVHWGAGAFGYFPTYSLGAMYACQIYQCALENVDGLESQVAAGDFAPVRTWLNKSIHEVGSLYPSGDELMTVATGSPLQPAVFLDYLNAKYSKLYGI